MAWSVGAESATNSSKSANQTAITATFQAKGPGPGENIVPGDVVIVFVGVDNFQTTDGDEGAVTSVTDSQGNTYTKAIEFCNGQGAAQAGCTISVWYSQITTTLTDAVDTITANFSNSTSRDASAIAAYNFHVAAGSSVEIEASTSLATDGADPGAITLSSLSNREHLMIAGLVGEGPNSDIYTIDSSYTLLSLPPGVTGTDSGGAASNIQILPVRRIATLTTDTVDHTSDSADRDYAQVLIAFNELTAGQPMVKRWGGVPFQAVNRGVW